MKVKTLFLIILTLKLICLSNVSAQVNNHNYHISEIDKKNIIKVNMLSPFMGTLSFQHEKILNSESSIQNGLYYFSGTIFNQQVPARGVCFTTEYRYYLTGEAPQGLYLQPFFRIARFWNNDLTFSNSNSDFYGTAFGLVFGKQFLFYDKFVLDIYGGPLFTKLFFDNKKVNTKDLPPMFNGYWIRAGLSIGYYF